MTGNRRPRPELPTSGSALDDLQTGDCRVSRLNRCSPTQAPNHLPEFGVGSIRLRTIWMRRTLKSPPGNQSPCWDPFQILSINFFLPRVRTLSWRHTRGPLYKKGAYNHFIPWSRTEKLGVFRATPTLPVPKRLLSYGCSLMLILGGT